MRARWLIVPTLSVLLAVALSGCGDSSSSTASASSPSARTSQAEPSTAPSSAGGGSGKLDPAAPTPSGFPSDLPVYGGARLTAGASPSAAGSTTYAMVWETTDSESQVQAYYASQLGQGNWTLIFGSGANGAYVAEFTRKGGKATGTMAIVTDSSTGVTKISLSLVVVA